MPRPSRLLCLVTTTLLVVACRDAAAPGTATVAPGSATASDTTSRYLISYSSFLGGSGDDGGLAIAVDAAGDMYIVGYTYSSDFPTAGALQTARHGQANDAFVTKVDPVTGLVYSTYLGGTDPDPLFGETATGIALDAQGDAYVTGRTYSTSFPTTPGALQTVFGGVNDAFVTVFGPAGSSLVYSTYLGGTGGEGANGIAVDGAGNAYVTGSTVTGFPITPGVVQSTPGGGGEGFVTALNAAGSALIYSTYLGGSGGDKGNKIAVDAAGSVYVIGNTGSTDFPTTPSALQTTLHGGNDAFVTALNSTGSTLLYSTYLGGTGGDQGNGIAVDAAGNAYLVGNTSSRDFPTTGTVVPPDSGGGSDAFVTALTSTGSGLLFSTYLGGTGSDAGFGIAVDAAGTAYVTGATGNLGADNFPITPGAFQPLFGGINDAYVTRITRVAAPAGASMRR